MTCDIHIEYGQNTDRERWGERERRWYVRAHIYLPCVFEIDKINLTNPFIVFSYFQYIACVEITVTQYERRVQVSELLDQPRNL